MTDEKTRALIAEARLAECSECSEEGTSPAMRCDGDLIRRLADALEVSTEAHERTKSGARTLGETIKQQCDDILKITNSQDLIGDDGDGDWEAVWGRAFGMRAKLDALSALTAPDGDARERLIEVLRTITPRLHEPLWTNVLGDQADAILAALPVLSRDIAGEIEAEIEQDVAHGGYLRGLRRAAEIARSGR